MSKKKKPKTAEQKAEQQALNVVADLRSRGLKMSNGSSRNYTTALKALALHMNQVHELPLRKATPKHVSEFLTDRAVEVGQSSLNMSRQAAERMLHYTKSLPADEKLEIVVTEKQEVLESRAYTQEQVAEIAHGQSYRHALATRIAEDTGVRSHELLTLRRMDEAKADERPVSEDKFVGREDFVPYIVKGKGGLSREIRMHPALSQELESNRLEKPVRVMDRGIEYTQKYDIGGGKNWSDSFSRASKSRLGWSTGGHGLRHSYAQARMEQLTSTVEYNRALEAVSQEMGHFRPEITKVYLR
ncbi:site-specific integrase [Vibrio breoganii]